MQYSPLHLVGKGLLVLALANGATAFWRMPCQSRSGLARMDPLVTPGEIAGHAHAIHGSSGFSMTSGTPELLAGQCTSCEVEEDKSAYWTPAVYFKHAATGKFELVPQIGGMLAYYLLYPNSGETTVLPFPTGFSMIAGDTFQRNFSYPVPDIEKSNWNVAPYNTQQFLRQAALGFNCLDYSGNPEPALDRHFLPDKAFLDAKCKNGVRFELMFPSCWNGKDLTSSDHKSHVAYPSQVMTGECPPEFPKRLISLFFETIWNTYEFVGVDGEFVISNGDPTGFGYHGDFIMGWDEEFLRSAVNTCTNPSGEISDCPLFTIQDKSVYNTCKFDEPIGMALEDLFSSPKSLPGSVPIGAGPEYAKPIAAPDAAIKAVAPAPAVPSPKLPGLVAAAIASPEPVEPKPEPTTSSSTSTSTTTTPAVTTPPPPPPTPSVSYYSTQYVTSGQVVNEILWIEDVVTVTAEYTSTIVGVQGRSHLNKHRRAHRN